MNEYNLEGLYRRLQKIMVQEKCRDVHDAMPMFHAALKSNPVELMKWWEALGLFWIKEAERTYWRRMGVVLAPEGQPTDVVPIHTDSAGQRRPARASAVSWREHPSVNPMDVVVPVGQTGERKRVGSFTKEDCAAMYAFYDKQGNDMIAQGKHWKRIADRMTTDETLDAAVHRLGEDEREYLSAKLRFPLAAKASAAAAA